MSEEESKETKTNKSQPIRGSASVGLVRALHYDYDNDKEPFLETETLTTKTDVSENLLGIGETATAKASAFECKAGVSHVEVGASALTATAHAEYGLQNSVGAEVSLVRAEANVGPLKVGTGVNFNCEATVGVNGIGATVLGTGFHIGPTVKMQTPFLDFSFNLF